MFIGGGISGRSKRPSVIMFVQERFLFLPHFLELGCHSRQNFHGLGSLKRVPEEDYPFQFPDPVSSCIQLER